jgi:hypothetical protein
MSVMCEKQVLHYTTPLTWTLLVGSSTAILLSRLGIELEWLMGSTGTSGHWGPQTIVMGCGMYLWHVPDQVHDTDHALSSMQVILWLWACLQAGMRRMAGRASQAVDATEYCMNKDG